ncbi:MAG: G-protein alpha subunit-domain-containing protein, partial [Olpidium bornovanus]
PDTPEPKSPLELTKEIEKLTTPEGRPRRVDAEEFNALATLVELARIVSRPASFFNDLERICKDDYAPTDEDILRARVRTQAVTRYAFVVGDMPLRIYDIGGHRSQRPRWASYFDDVEAVLFVAAVSSYDQTVEEDPEINRIVDSQLHSIASSTTLC